MQKFWNKTDNEIYIYGDIVNDKWFDTDVTAKSFAEDFYSCKGNVTLHINSNGGDCFVAMAIYNLIKDSGKKVTATIDGIAASAATIIACAADEVKMAANALYMIHLPSVFLADMFDKNQLSKIEGSLLKVEGSLIQTYKTRTSKTETELQQMLEAETWLTAEEAKEHGFIDTITGAVETEIDDAHKLIILNKVKVRQDYFLKAKEKLKMEDKTFWQKMKDILKGEDEVTPDETETDKDKDSDTDKDIENKVRAQELSRIKNLNALRCGNKFIDALIDTAISEGRAADDVQKYVDALKNVKVENTVANKIAALIEDHLTSGAADVQGSFGEDKKPGKVTAEMISKYANER